MKLEISDKKTIANVMAARYFSEEGWKWLNLKDDAGKLYGAFEELEDQYESYPYMSKDWYVSNSATYGLHRCNNWEELARLIDFLRYYEDIFDFFVINNGKKVFCIIDLEGVLTEDQKTAIYQARKIGYGIYIFHAEVPDSLEFELAHIGGVA